MVQLNSHNEIADFLDESQFLAGHSAYECCAYAVSLCKYCGEPGHGPSGNGLEVTALAQFWYGKEEGSNLASNTNGMSLQAMQAMLQGVGLPYHNIPVNGNNAHDIVYVHAWLLLGYPVLVCGAESGMYDLGLGDIVPYSWSPSGNHCIVASGIGQNGNLLVHDTASIVPTGVRSGPRLYDASKMQLVSATAVQVGSWLPSYPADFDPTQQQEESPPVTINISTPEVAAFFTELNANQWQCKSNNKVIQYGILSFYVSFGNSGLCGLTYLGLPLTDEIPIESLPPGYPQFAGHGIVVQFYERGSVIYDPQHLVSNPPGSGSVYTLNVSQGPGQLPVIAQLQSQIATLQKELASGSTFVSVVNQIKQLVAPL